MQMPISKQISSGCVCWCAGCVLWPDYQYIFHFNDNMHTLASKSSYNRLKHDVLFGKKITCVILEKLLFIFWLWLVAHSVRQDVLLLTNWFSFYLYKLFSLDFPIKQLMFGFFSAVVLCFGFFCYGNFKRKIGARFTPLNVIWHIFFMNVDGWLSEKSILKTKMCDH